jgi:shikimate kinase
MSEQNIFLVGLMAVGKSTVGRQLAEALGQPFFDSDHEIEKRAGAEIAWIFDVEGEAGFRDREEQIIDDLSQMKGIVMATGGGAVLRDSNRRNLAARGMVFHLDSSLEKLYARTHKDKKRPLLQSTDPHKVLRDLKTKRAPLYEEIEDHCISTDRQNAASVVRQILRILDKKITDKSN